MMNENLPNHLFDHNYFQPVDYENDSFEKEVEYEIIFSDEEVEEIVLSGVSETYTVVPGVQHRSRIYVDNLGFKYHKRYARGNQIYLRCERQKNSGKFCPSTASVNTDLKDNSIVLFHHHNHKPGTVDLKVSLMRHAIGEKGLDPSLSTKFMRTLYNNEIVNHPEAAANYSFLQAKARVKRMRRLRLPLRSQNIHKHSQTLNEACNANYTSIGHPKDTRRIML